MGKIIHISVRDKVALYSARDGAIVCGNDDYRVQFALDPEWDGVPAKARFIWNGQYEDAPIVDGIAKVPRIIRAHEVRVGVYSEDESLQTTTAARVPCSRSILCDTAEPTEGNEAFYASEAQEAADRAEAAADRAEAAGGSGGGGGGAVTAYEPAPDDLPSLFFTGTHFPATKAEEDVPNTVTYVSNTDKWTAHSTTKVQGSGSTANAKKNLTLKLYTDEAMTVKKKVAFRNWPKKNKFILKAYMPDITHARDPVTCRIFGDAVKTRPDYDSLPEELRNSPNQGAIDGFLVRVYLNGIYYGLYTLTIPKDDWMVGTSDCEKGGVNYDKHVLLCGEGVGEALQYILFRTAYPDISKVGNGYDFDDELNSLGPVTKQNLMEFQHLVVNGSDAEFKANISSYLDIESAIDAYLMIFYGCGVDTIGKNQTLLTYNSGKPWYITIYDADAYWGNHPSSSRLFAYDTEFQTGYITSNGQTNRLYERLWECFREEIRARWNELKNTVFNPANVITSFRRFLAPATTEDIELDSAPTTADGQFVDGSNLGSGFNSFTHYNDGDFAHLQNFVGKRFGYVDSVINFIACTGITLVPNTLTFTEAGQATLTATVNEGCNESIVWISDNEDVVTVGANGYGQATVTAVYNGTATITATCGAYSATCSVSVSGFEEAVSSNLAGATGKGEELTFGKCYKNTDLIEYENSLHTKAFPFNMGDIYYVYGYDPRYSGGGYGQIQGLNEAGRFLGYRSPDWTVYADGPSRTANGKTVYTYTAKITNVPAGTMSIILNGTNAFDNGVTYPSVTGGTYIIQRNEPITEETLAKYEAMVAASG